MKLSAIYNLINKVNLIDKYHLNDPVCKTKLQKSELVISTITINLLSLSLPLMVLQVYDRLLFKQNVGTLYVLGTGVCIAMLLEGLLRITRSYATSWSGMVYEYSMATNAMRCYINSDPAKIKHDGVGKQIKNLGSFSKLRNLYSGQTLIALIDIPFAAIFLLLIAYLAGWLVFIPVILIGVFSYVTLFMGNKLMDAMEVQNTHDDKRYNFIIETLQGIHSIKSYGTESVFQRRYEALEEKSSSSNYYASIISATGHACGIFLGELTVILVATFGAPLVINNTITTGALMATILLSGRFIQPLQKALLVWSQFQDYRIAYSKAEQIFSIEQIDRSKTASDDKNLGEIKINDLSFSYHGHSLLENINLNLKKLDVISIEGKAGDGREALLNLIAGISDPTSGEVLVNGITSSSLPSEELVKHVGFISSENTMFHGTILENLTAFDPAKEKNAMDLAALLDIDKEVELLPEGYETKIIDGFADSIPPGLKQRISIARILVNKPKIILFNNADKGLDKDGYHKLMKLMHMLKGQVTMIIATDDNNISTLASKHYVLKNKKLTLTKNK